MMAIMVLLTLGMKNYRKREIPNLTTMTAVFALVPLPVTQ